MIPDYQSGRQGFLDKLGSFIVGFGVRMVVHACAFMTAIFAASTLDLPGGSGLLGGVSVGFSVYIGIICLIPRGMKRTADWLIPVSSGLVLIALWVLQGIPWQLSLLWGGGVTWLIRQLVKKCQIDWDFAVLPWLLVCLYSSFTSLLPLVPASPPWWSFFALTIAGWMATLLYVRLRGDSAQRKLLSGALARLEKKVEARSLPGQIRDAAIDMLHQGRLFLKQWPRFDKESSGLVNDFALSADSLEAFTPATGGGLVQKQLVGMKRITSAISQRLEALERRRREESPQAAMDKALAARIQEFRENALQLLDKSMPLSLRVRRHVDGIARATEKILACMRDDPQDIPQADRFLSRYLRSAHSLVDEYARLSTQGSTHPAIGETLARSENLLERLEAAFNAEYDSLLQNDTINFTAELNVLDKLLTMDGK